MPEQLGPPEQYSDLGQASQDFLTAFDAAQQPTPAPDVTKHRPRGLNQASKDFEAEYRQVGQPDQPEAAVPEVTPDLFKRPSDYATRFVKEYDAVMAANEPQVEVTAQPELAPASPATPAPPSASSGPNWMEGQPRTPFTLVASSKSKEAVSSPESVATLEQQSAYWKQIAEGTGWATLVAKPSGGNPDLVPGWETGWKGFAIEGSGPAELNKVPDAMVGAFEGLRGTAPVDYLIQMPSERMGRPDDFMYYTFLTRSTNPYDGRDDGAPGLAVHFRLPRDGAPDATSGAFDDALAVRPELADHMVRRLFGDEFDSGVVQRANSDRLCLILGSQFVDMLDGPPPAFWVPGFTMEQARKATSGRLAKIISTHEAQLQNEQSDVYYVDNSGAVVQGQVPDLQRGAQFVDLPYEPGLFPRTGGQPIDDALRQRAEHEAPTKRLAG